MTRTSRRLATAALGTAALFAALQLVPYGRDYTNPPVVAEPRWDSAGTRALAARACFDCHSNQTQWPGYARIAPGSWLIVRDVAEGREHLNFSEWQRPQEDAHEAPDVVREKEMPPVQYRLLHPEARLTDAEREQLARGLEATLERADDETVSQPPREHSLASRILSRAATGRGTDGAP